MKTLMIGLAMLSASGTAGAADFGAVGWPVFDVAPLGDAALAGVTGRAGVAPLTAGTMRRIVDDGGRADLRQTGSVAGIQMDVWWGTIGSELIAQSVRADDAR